MIGIASLRAGVLLLLLAPALPSCTGGESGPPRAISRIVTSPDDPRLRHRNGLLYLGDSLFGGTLVERYPDGSRASVAPYAEGRVDGMMLAWYPDGTHRYERRFVAGKREGDHRGWWENGRLQFLFHFRDDLHEGLAEEYFPSGQPFRKFTYSHGAESGSQRMWNADGSLRANYVVMNGRRYGSIGSRPCISSVDDRITPREQQP